MKTKTYKTYSRCIKSCGKALPATINGERCWVGWSDFVQRQALGDEIAYTPGSPDNPSFDRVFRIDSIAGVFGVVCDLARGYSEVPTLTLFSTRKAAEDYLRECARRYATDERWQAVSR